MYLLSIWFILPIIHALVTVEIHRNSLYKPLSSCAFIRNATSLKDVQSCIWECVNENDCQTAVYSKDDRICSMFAELCQTGYIETFANIFISVICYRKNPRNFVFCCHIKAIFVPEPIITCSSTATLNQRTEESTSKSDMITSTRTSMFQIFILNYRFLHDLTGNVYSPVTDR
jgi:hypothetical protein